MESTKSTCEKCSYFECTDINGEILEKGFCWLQDLYTYVDDDAESCEHFIIHPLLKGNINGVLKVKKF